MDNNFEMNKEIKLKTENNNEDIKVTTEKQLHKKEQSNLWSIIISGLLLLVVILNSVLLFSVLKQNNIENQRADEYQQRVSAYDEQVKEAQRMLSSQQFVISSLIDDYEEAVYDNPRVDTIYQQQFRATEYSLIALQIIASQNSQIIQLLSSMP